MWSGLSLHPQYYLVGCLPYSLCIEYKFQLTISMITNKCQYCGKDTTNPKFCSKSCSATSNNKTIPKRKIKKKCSRCDSLVRNYRSLLCEYHYQEYLNNKTEGLKELTLAHYTTRECLKSLHASSKFAHVRGLNRSWNKDKLSKPCQVCGYSKHVELAHIKSISSFNSYDTLGEINHSNNVVQLCPNCHWEFDNGLITLAFPDQAKFN